MGYITSATTTYIDLHMTARGRKFLLQGSLADQITQFALSDVDKDTVIVEFIFWFILVFLNHENCIWS